jgi:histone-lysine N-methyltransferase SETMAR
METNVIHEQRIVVKFLWKLGKPKHEILHDLVQVYGEHALKQRTVEKWIQLFRQGRESTEDDPRSGRPSTSTSSDCIDAVKALVQDNRKITTREIEEALHISHGSVIEILHDKLHMTKISSRWVPRLLTKEMKEIRQELCLNFLNKFDMDPDNFLNRIVTGDETWLYLYDPAPKQATMEWHTAEDRVPVKPEQQKSSGKVMATVFFDCQGILLIQYLEPGQTVTAARYEYVLTSLREAIKENRRGMISKGVILHHDNAPAHTSKLIQEALHKHRFEILPHPPYSPDLAPCDFHLFPRIKKHLKGKKFGSLPELQRAFEDVIHDQTTDFFHSAFTDWHHRAEKCIALNGDYVEK